MDAFGPLDILISTDSSLSFFQELLPRQLTLSEYLHPETWSTIAKLDSNPELRSFAQPPRSIGLRAWRT